MYLEMPITLVLPFSITVLLNDEDYHSYSTPVIQSQVRCFPLASTRAIPQAITRPSTHLMQSYTHRYWSCMHEPVLTSVHYVRVVVRNYQHYYLSLSSLSVHTFGLYFQATYNVHNSPSESEEPIANPAMNEQPSTNTE